MPTYPRMLEPMNAVGIVNRLPQYAAAFGAVDLEDALAGLARDFRDWTSGAWQPAPYRAVSVFQERWAVARGLAQAADLQILDAALVTLWDSALYPLVDRGVVPDPCQ